MAVSAPKKARLALDPELRAFTYRDLLAMEKAGILDESEHVELLGGQLFKMTIHPPHAFTVAELTERLTLAFVEKAKLVSQSPLRLSDDLDDTELPQPDLMLLKRRYYLDHPRPEDVLLLIEVSDSTLQKDQGLKLPLYAQVGIPEVWIVNLVQRRTEVYTVPKEGEYGRRINHDLTAVLAPSAFPDVGQAWLPEEIHEVLDAHA
jgi:Uma2 family endonuclease